MNVHYLETIKRFEGFTAAAKWDFAQHSNGYGTKALYPGEVISKAEAEQRFAAEISSARAAVTRFAPGLDEGTEAALTSLTYNAGPGWMRSGLGAAIKAGDLDAAKQIFVQYVHAGGQRLAGLEARRAAEVQWIGQQQAAVPDAMRAASDASPPPLVAVRETGVEAEPGQLLSAFAPAASSHPASPQSVPGSLSSDALTRSLFFETIAIFLAAQNKPNKRGDGEAERSLHV